MRHGTLLRPEQWLPGALAAQIPLRHALPAPQPTAAASAPATRPDAQPYAHGPTELAQPAPAAAPPPPYGHPYPVRPPKKSKAPYVLAAVVAVVALAVVVPLAVKAGGGSGADASKDGGSRSSPC